MSILAGSNSPWFENIAQKINYLRATKHPSIRFIAQVATENTKQK